ncbi:putative aldouronate transport system permease protein [Anaerobacterium chartisolvens]|uniref:Putative aldouronate transport system permease protein n=1 Tax=Anaerobacterium chartisolvens TaxID=1297424 RepID=A0A369B3G1_9FIRM|nr:putative aldouronate transport system permease protein [Anaerobacterium chartisolvens]
MASIKSCKSRKVWIDCIPYFLMMIPGLLYLLINNYLPMAGLIIAFKDVNFSKGLFNSDWAGFKNFQFLFGTSDALIITRNTILYNASFIVINTVVAVGVAILLNEITKKFLSRFYQSAILLPYLISMVIVSYLVFSVLSVEAGFINNSILPLFGKDTVMWYSEASYWPYILVLVNSWKGYGFFCIIYLASIIGIDKEYYEAAIIDGAGKWKQIWTITIPLIQPTIVMMVLLAIGRIFYSDFGLFYQVPMNSGALYDTTSVIDTYVYRGLLQLGDIGMSSAAGLYQSVVGFILVLAANLVVRKINRDNALF